MSVENGTTVSTCVSKVRVYRQVDQFVKIELFKVRFIPLRDISWSHVTSVHSLLRIYGVDYSRYTLWATLNHGASTENVTTFSTSAITVGRLMFNNRVK